MASTNSLAARLRSELTTANGRSRSGTPDVRTPPLVNIALPGSPSSSSKAAANVKEEFVAPVAALEVPPARRSSEESDESAVMAAITDSEDKSVVMTDGTSTPQLAGTKRKADSDDTGVKSDHDGDETPVNKKLALAAEAKTDGQVPDAPSLVVEGQEPVTTEH